MSYLNRVRRAARRTETLAGDAQAVSRDRVVQRAVNRAIGRSMRRAMRRVWR
jgi:hypothetical protein